MEHNIAVQDANRESIDSVLKLKRKKILIWIGVLIVTNTTMFTISIPGQDYSDKFEAALNGNLIGMNIVGFILGTLFALIPNKNLPYAKKYIHASLLTILVLQIIMTVGLVAISLMKMAGWYR